VPSVPLWQIFFAEGKILCVFVAKFLISVADKTNLPYILYLLIVQHSHFLFILTA